MIRFAGLITTGQCCTIHNSHQNILSYVSAKRLESQGDTTLISRVDTCLGIKGISTIRHDILTYLSLLFTDSGLSHFKLL